MPTKKNLLRSPFMLQFKLAIFMLKSENKCSLRWSVFCIAASVVLSNCFQNELSVKNRPLFNFYKKTVWQFDVRSHVTQDLEDTLLF